MNVTSDQMDLLKELINIGVGHAAGDLHEMTGYHICLSVPDVRIASSKDIVQETLEEKDQPLASVFLGFFGRISGTAGIVFPPESANTLVNVIEGVDDDQDEGFNELKAGTLNEVGNIVINIVINSVMGSIGNIVQRYINYTTPTYVENSLHNLLASRQNFPNAGSKGNENGVILLAKTRFTIKEKNVHGEILLLFDVASFDELISAVDDLLKEVGG